MTRHHFLGITDLRITIPLLTNYNGPTEIPDGIQLNKIKQHDDFVLIELGTLLTPNECDEILAHINPEDFQNLSNKYDPRKRNNSRLIVMDDQLAHKIWQRLEFSNKLTKLVSNTQPLGFNVQGTWKLDGVNPAMRINKYNAEEYFSPHKDAQYAPSNDERSLFSLLIYLNDNYEKGETKFYFPKLSNSTNIKGLTINEEIHAHGGLENGYECITLKPKKGYAVLFTHNLLHEAVAPEFSNDSIETQRFVLRTDVLVKRKEKVLGFAISSEEKEDYLACLNYFREAQQNELKEYEDYGMLVNTMNTGELYERSLSIRYCYPRLLETNIQKEKANLLMEKLPPEMWLQIFKFLNEHEMQTFIFAYPKFQLLKMIWQAREIKQIESDPSLPKFIPTIDAQYGCATLFRFSGANFFDQHIDACCRVAAVYAFFLLGHEKDSKMYTVRYNPNTQEACEVNTKQLFSDVFHNRNCYGSLYRVNQKSSEQRQPLIDLDDSVDRTYMTNRHQSQFIGQDLTSRLHLRINELHSSDHDPYSDSEYYPRLDEEKVISYQRNKIIYYNNERIGNEYPTQESDHVLGYQKNIFKQTEQNSSTSLFRMVSSKDELFEEPQGCYFHRSIVPTNVRKLIRLYNHLIFDFETHQLNVKRVSDEYEPYFNYNSLVRNCIRTLEDSVSEEHSISYYRVNIEKLARETKGFNHAACQCAFPKGKVDQFSFLDYTYLSHVNLIVAHNIDHVSVLAVYGGIVAL